LLGARARLGGVDDELFVLALVVILVPIRLGSVVPFILASAVAGGAQGATFAGSLRALLAETRPVDAPVSWRLSTPSRTRAQRCRA
jgi:hypothetical protein